MTELKINVSVECSACGEQCTVEPLNEHLPDRGWVINASEIGYYGGFSDNIEYLLGEENLLWKLCHDCVVKMLQTFPLLAKTIQAGGHHCESDLPCCDYAWRQTGDTLETAKGGAWVSSDWDSK